MGIRPALFLDRDGVIVEEVDHLSNPSQLCLIPGSARAIADVNGNGIPVIVVTNQAGIARGYYPYDRVDEIHQGLSNLLAIHGSWIDRYYYCPHHPTEGLAPYRVNCQCRKPKAGMLLEAAAELRLDLSVSYMIGDKVSDLEAGTNAGCRTILVKTGYGHAALRSLNRDKYTTIGVAENLAEAVKLCLPNLLRSCGD